MGHLTGKTAIITGGGRAVLSDGRCGSIGYGIATAYAKEGCNLVLTGRNMQKLEDAKKELETFWAEVKRIKNPHKYYVDLSQKLWDLKHALLQKYCVDCFK